MTVSPDALATPVAELFARLEGISPELHAPLEEQDLQPIRRVGLAQQGLLEGRQAGCFIQQGYSEGDQR